MAQTGLVQAVGDRRPQIADTAWVAPGATDPISIGRGSNIQDLSVMHADPGFPCTAGAGVSVGHRAVLHGCTVEDDVLIGMGAVVLNGARIGRGSLVAAGAVVLGGTEVPPGSLVAGVPATVRRELTDEELAENRRSATHYVELAGVNGAEQSGTSEADHS